MIIRDLLQTQDTFFQASLLSRLHDVHSLVSLDKFFVLFLVSPVTEELNVAREYRRSYRPFFPYTHTPSKACETLLSDIDIPHPGS